MQAAIHTEHLRKMYGNKVAVKDLTLTVEQGEVFGFLGPNGAGKTTSVKMLLNLISPTSGKGTILGEPISNPSIRHQIGFLPEHFRFHEWLTAKEFLKLHAELYHLPEETIRKRVPELLDRVGLFQHADKKLNAFSKGMLQRIGLAQAMLNNPKLVFLDEPTSGLDPVGRRLVRDIIHELRQKGTTVFLNSHFLSEVEITCDRVAFIKRGEVIHTSPLKAILDSEMKVEIQTRNISPSVLDGMDRQNYQYQIQGDTLVVNLDKEERLPDLNRYLVEQGVDVFSLRPIHLSLEDLFIQIVGGEDEL